MNPITIPMSVKASTPAIITFGLLALIVVAIGFVVYMLCRHHHRTRKAKKLGHSPHTGRHGNH